MQMTFSALTEQDLPEVYGLCSRCFGEEASFAEVQKTYQLCREDPHYRFLVGKLEGKVVAYTTMSLFQILFDGLRPIATLWYVCVDESYRRMGLGKQLFAEIERIAAEANCESIYLTCLKGNKSAQQFYRSLGYTDQQEFAFVKHFDRTQSE